jgi:hypothetical protein
MVADGVASVRVTVTGAEKEPPAGAMMGVRVTTAKLLEQAWRRERNGRVESRRRAGQRRW